ncbi:dethiobiotin synthase [Serratia sp. UGAL515B_01]|uniref:dethiobiotin synthase n=1 Tax=Serratia sp. UGAL515B_01 TaxID=2986763 RepID=UPI002955339A|nr:dethiobiotin synthase [Serratia sp. UGAL515B_01]WON78606.1 dethiobiotin synthase [Serratia sp. UGAL515B_01]
MLKRLFVTSTDTDVGKTVVSRGLLQAFAAQGLSVAGYKPIAASCLETSVGIRNRDALVLQGSSTLPLSYEEVNPITCLDETFYANTAQDIDYGLMSRGLEHLASRADTVVVEGSDGWRVLMNDLRPYAEWVVQEQLPIILVVGIKLGCVSHAILTVQSIINDGLPLLGWVANRINPGMPHYAETISVLQQRIPAPLLGEIPYLPRAEQRELAQYLDISSLMKY